jgi:hypothetical protein
MRLHSENKSSLGSSEKSFFLGLLALLLYHLGSGRVAREQLFFSRGGLANVKELGDDVEIF